jgi:hypothetical protein
MNKVLDKPEEEEIVKKMLSQLALYQARAKERDPEYWRMRQRFVSGIKQVC